MVQEAERRGLGSIAVFLLGTLYGFLRSARFVWLLAGTYRRWGQNTFGTGGSLCRPALGGEALQMLQESTTREEQ